MIKREPCYALYEHILLYIDDDDLIKTDYDKYYTKKKLISNKH